MNRSKSNSSRIGSGLRAIALQSERGVAATELALIIPFLIAFAFASLELARALHFAKMVSTVSREAANEALRECSPVWESPQPCLDQVQLNATQYASSSLTGVRVIVSLYKWDSGSIAPLGMSPAPAAQEEGTRTQVCIAGCSRPLDSDMVEAADLVAVGEVYSTYKPVISFLPDFFSFNPKVLYDVTYF